MFVPLSKIPQVGVSGGPGAPRRAVGSEVVDRGTGQMRKACVSAVEKDLLLWVIRSYRWALRRKNPTKTFSLIFVLDLLLNSC